MGQNEGKTALKKKKKALLSQLVMNDIVWPFQLDF